MRIVQLKAENIKRLKAVDITPPPHTVKVSGKNEQGKTSLLDSIFWALGGKKVIDDKPIRRGEKKGSIKLDLGDYVVERSFTEKGSYLSVTTKDGAKYPSPQKLIDKIFTEHTFDPMSFINADPDDQLVAVKDLAGLDFTDLDQKRKDAYTKRTEAKKKLNDLQMAQARIDVPDDAPDEEVNITELINKLNQVTQENQEYLQLTADCERFVERITELKQQLKDAEAYHAELTQRLGQVPYTDPTPLQEKIENAEAQNQLARKKQSRKEYTDQIMETSGYIERASKFIKQVDERKALLMSQAKFPIDGLGFDDDGVTFDGLPLRQASFAQKLKIAISIAMALNNQLRVIRLTDASMLDEDNMKAVEEMAQQHDFQVWMEIVDGSGDIGFYIEDGEIKVKEGSAA